MTNGIVDRHRAIIRTEGGVPLDVIDANLTMDETWAPFIQAEVTVKPDFSVLGVSSDLDPRNSKTIGVVLVQTFGDFAVLADLSYSYPFGSGPTLADVTTNINGLFTLAQISALIASTDWNPTAINPTGIDALLQLRRTRTRLDGSLVLNLASVEAKMQDIYDTASSGYVSAAAWPQSGDTVTPYTLRQAYASVLTEGTTGTRFAYSIPLEYGTTDALLPITGSGYKAMWKHDGSLWDCLADASAAAGLRFWGDKDGKIRLDTATRTSPGTLTMTGTTNVTAALEDIDLDSATWGDGVILDLEFNTIAGQPWSTVDPTHDSFRLMVTYPTATAFRNPRLISRTGLDMRADLVTTDYTAWASSTYSRVSKRVADVPITATNDFTARPGMNASITLADLGTYTAVVQAVKFDLKSKTMTVTTKDLVKL